jgi:DNA invertase Pin-like site-specific DNA recombinase
MPLRSDPGRLPRRNHYQEGPGFLFLATQGGRPLQADVAADIASMVRLRAAALRRWHEGDPAMQVAAELGIGRATLYRWQGRYEEQGLAGLVDAPRLGRASELDPVLAGVAELLSELVATAA